MSTGEPGAAAVSPILLHPAPPVHDSINMLDDELKASDRQNRTAATGVAFCSTSGDSSMPNAGSTTAAAIDCSSCSARVW